MQDFVELIGFFFNFWNKNEIEIKFQVKLVANIKVLSFFF